MDSVLSSLCVWRASWAEEVANWNQALQKSLSFLPPTYPLCAFQLPSRSLTLLCIRKWMLNALVTHMLRTGTSLWHKSFNQLKLLKISTCLSPSKSVQKRSPCRKVVVTALQVSFSLELWVEVHRFPPPPLSGISRAQSTLDHMRARACIPLFPSPVKPLMKELMITTAWPREI